jgi:hypothetical protein
MSIINIYTFFTIFYLKSKGVKKFITKKTPQNLI